MAKLSYDAPMLHTLKITTSAGTATVTYSVNYIFYYVFDNVNKILTIFQDSAHTSSLAVFTGVISYTTELLTVA